MEQPQSEVFAAMFNCAAGRGRTDTKLPSLDFESNASANSATAAKYREPHAFHMIVGISQILAGSFLCENTCSRGPFILMTGS